MARASGTPKVVGERADPTSRLTADQVTGCRGFREREEASLLPHRTEKRSTRRLRHWTAVLVCGGKRSFPRTSGWISNFGPQALQVGFSCSWTMPSCDRTSARERCRIPFPVVPPQPVLIIVGPPGAGKSTVARIVAKQLGDRTALVEADWFWTTIVNGFVLPWKTEADDQNRVVLQACASCAVSLAAGGYAIVLEGVFGPWFLPVFGSVITGAGLECSYAVLRPSLDVALVRATSRQGDERVAGHPAPTDPEPIRHMWNQFADLGDYERHAIDSTALTSEATANLVVERLRDGSLRL